MFTKIGFHSAPTYSQDDIPELAKLELPVDELELSADELELSADELELSAEELEFP